MKKTLGILVLLSFMQNVYADAYYFRSPLAGVKSNVDNSLPENGNDNEQEAIDETPWVQFADDNNLAYLEDWSCVSWQRNGFITLPSEPYPNSHLSCDVNLYRNSLINLDGLYSVTQSDSYLGFGHNQLENVDGLRNLIYVGDYLALDYNNLKNVDGLSSLKNIEGSLLLQENPLENLNGISNLIVAGSIKISEEYSGEKLSANSIFCQQNDEDRFAVSEGFASKNIICY